GRRRRTRRRRRHHVPRRARRHIARHPDRRHEEPSRRGQGHGRVDRSLGRTAPRHDRPGRRPRRLIGPRRQPSSPAHPSLPILGAMTALLPTVNEVDAARTSAPPGPRPMSKVPEVTAVFWITKVLTTVMGETTSDFFAHRFSPYLAVALGGAGLVGALALQFRAGGLAVGTGLVSLVL